MPLADKHPCYVEKLPDWELMSDVYAGERKVKDEATKYLPATNGMIAAGYGTLVTAGGRPTIGQQAYEAYRMRAIFHGFVRQAVSGLIGVVHRKPPKVVVPDALLPMVESMTINGESLELMWKRITEAQLVYGRIGALVDVPSGTAIGDTVPFVALYAARAITNWDAGRRQQGRAVLELVVLDETTQQRSENLTWEEVKQFRVLSLSGVVANADEEDQSPSASGDYVVAEVVFDEKSTGEVKASDFVTPSVGGRPLDRIPFVFVNTNDTVPEPDVPPLLNLANLDVAIYRGEADYRQSLFMQGQDTLVIVGRREAEKVPVGAGAVLDLPMGGSASYVGVSGAGLTEQRSALENDKLAASAMAVQLLDTSGGAQQSGEALRVRVSARTATLSSMQLTAAAAIRDILVLAGRWIGISETVLAEIEIEPNLDFSDATVAPQDISMLMDAKVKGAPISEMSIHAWLARNEYTTMGYDEENEQILAEKTDKGEGAGFGGDLDSASSQLPGGPVADPETDPEAPPDEEDEDEDFGEDGDE